MKNIFKGLTLSLCLAAGFGMATASYAQSAKEDKDAARQTQADTPQMAYQRKVKEIRSAHRDNLANCKSAPASERKACVKEANDILKSDLADAKQLSKS